LWLTTDEYKALCGLSVTAELLVDFEKSMVNIKDVKIIKMSKIIFGNNSRSKC